MYPLLHLRIWGASNVSPMMSCAKTPPLVLSDDERLMEVDGLDENVLILWKNVFIIFSLSYSYVSYIVIDDNRQVSILIFFW